MAELLAHLQRSGSSRISLESLLQRILEPVISNFNLQQYAAYVESASFQALYSSVQSDCGEGQRRPGDTRAGPIKALYERASAHDQGTPRRLLATFPPQASKFTNAQLQNFLMPALEELIPIMDASAPDIQECLQSLLTTFIIRTVGKEPARPSDWARPEGVISKPTYDMRCDHRIRMNEFLMDPTAQTHKISSDEVTWSLRYRYDHLEYSEVDHAEGKLVTVTKTLKHFEKQHQKWDQAASVALEALRKLPQAALQPMLAAQYQEIMDLRMVKVGYDDGKDESNAGGSASAESNSDGRIPQQDGSTVLRKRPREVS